MNYQGIDPAELGRGHELVLGKHSGTGGVIRALADLGLSIDRVREERVLQRIRAFVMLAKRPPTASELLCFADELGPGAVSGLEPVSEPAMADTLQAVTGGGLRH